MDHDRGEGLLSDNAICPVVLSWSCCRTLIASGSRRAFSIAAFSASALDRIRAADAFTRRMRPPHEET